ncbi:glycine cleavage system protein GcvH [Magnetococcales bacterium HHB-1]
MSIRENLKYTQEHEWVDQNGDELTIGISQFAAEQLGDIVFVELPEVGSQVTAGEPFGTVESVKSVSDLFAPVSGEVTAINETLQDAPENVNESPYDEGWMIRIKTEDTETQLLSPAEYAELIKDAS